MSKATDLFQFIHTNFDDLYSFTQKSHKYYISFFNNYFKVIYIYFLKNKNEIFSEFKEYKTAIELQSDKKIKFICSDNEGEYKNLKFNKVLKKFNVQ